MRIFHHHPVALAARFGVHFQAKGYGTKIGLAPLIAAALVCLLVMQEITVVISTAVINMFFPLREGENGKKQREEKRGKHLSPIGIKQA